MNVVVDTHVVLWWFTRTTQLSGRALATLKSPQNRVYVSACVAWEFAIKANLGKLKAQELVSNLPELLFEEGFRRLSISVDHAIRAGALPPHHKDPFDRMLVAQAQALGFPIVSADATLDRYGVTRIW